MRYLRPIQAEVIEGCARCPPTSVRSRISEKAVRAGIISRHEREDVVEGRALLGVANGVVLCPAGEHREQAVEDDYALNKTIPQASEDAGIEPHVAWPS